MRAISRFLRIQRAPQLFYLILRRCRRRLRRLECRLFGGVGVCIGDKNGVARWSIMAVRYRTPVDHLELLGGLFY